MAARLQHRSAAQQPGQPVADRLCHAQRPGIATGRDAARNRGLRAPLRCSTEPDRLKWLTDSTYPWMRNGAQVIAAAQIMALASSMRRVAQNIPLLAWVKI